VKISLGGFGLLPIGYLRIGTIKRGFKASFKIVIMMVSSLNILGLDLLHRLLRSEIFHVYQSQSLSSPAPQHPLGGLLRLVERLAH
jgi:hypothetical protein